jgi:hypothetical protein
VNTERLNYYRSLARRGNANAQRVVDAFADDWDPDQPRDSDGKWGAGGGSVGTTRSGKAVIAPEKTANYMGGSTGGTSTPLGNSHSIEHMQRTSTSYSQQDHYDADKILMAAARAAQNRGDHDRAFHLGSVASAHKLAAQGKLPSGNAMMVRTRTSETEKMRAAVFGGVKN